jgi:hypothetical protein
MVFNSSYRYIIQKNKNGKRTIRKNIGNIFNKAVNNKFKMIIKPASFSRHYLTIYPLKKRMMGLKTRKNDIKNRIDLPRAVKRPRQVK